VRPGQELPDHRADDRRAAETAAHQHLESDLVVPLHRVQTDVVDADRGPVVPRAIDRELELARQVGELGMEGRPLAQDLAPDEGVDDLVGGDAGELVGGDVAERVARGLDRVHLHARQLGEDVGHLLEARPVELQVLARREVAVGAVVLARDLGKFSELSTG
jgi:hypothetical protein